MTESTDCTIYRCERKEGAYLYLAAGHELDSVPADVSKLLQPFVEVMSLSLTPASTLANADTAVVIRDLQAQGFYLQLPPPVVPGARAGESGS